MSEFKIGDRVSMPGVPFVVEVLEIGTCEEPDCHGDDAEIFRFKDPGGQGDDWMHSTEFVKADR